MKLMTTKTLLLMAGLATGMMACQPKEKTTPNADETPTTEVSASIQTLTPEESQAYAEKGKMIAKATFEALSGNLKKALKEGGVKEASEYCNIVAMPLTDSLATLHQASIKRTSLKLRNPENKPSANELSVLKEYEQLAMVGSELNPRVQAIGSDRVAFYAPIKTQQLCLSCHGVIGEELTRDNYAILYSLYPEDQATGYADNQFRGMWSIEFQR